MSFQVYFTQVLLDGAKYANKNQKCSTCGELHQRCQLKDVKNDP